MLSIIMPCYNHNAILPKAVRTALAQSCEKEIIIVDDGSIKPIENQWGEQVQIIRHDKNRGLSAALNTGIEASNFDQYVILSSDDELHPRYSDLMLDHIKKADIISCDFAGDRGRKVSCKPGSIELLKHSNCHSYAALVKKVMWKKVGGYKEAMNPSWEDWEFWLNCAKHKATWYHVPLPLHIYHRSPNGRDVDAQNKEGLLKAKFKGYHQDIFGKGQGVVTFIIPCYDQEKYLAECIASIKNQIYPHVEIIVIDDESPGNVKEVIKDAGFKNVTVIRQKNTHLSGARNTGVRTAIKKFNSQFLVMLDADDKVHSNFVEETLSLYEPKTYVYTDIKLFGDAWHPYPLPEYDCKTLSKRHMHACTFLMETKMWEDVVKNRGYGYDESMKEGYEDWEFALACIKAGYCGRKVPSYLFYYRNHADGSMRTEAEKINKKLYSYIRTKHQWIQNEGKVSMACSTCGGRKYSYKVFNTSGGMVTIVNIPGLGDVDSREPIVTTYAGPTTSQIKKIGKGLPGQGAAVYRYSALDPTFTFIAGDIHLFINGPFKNFSRISELEAV